jgi:K+-transporting ATPase KdpF subunit
MLGNIILIAIAVRLCGYLLYALLKPESFYLVAGFWSPGRSAFFSIASTSTSSPGWIRFCGPSSGLSIAPAAAKNARSKIPRRP